MRRALVALLACASLGCATYERGRFAAVSTTAVEVPLAIVKRDAEGRSCQQFGSQRYSKAVEKAIAGAREASLENVEFRKGFGEELPVENGWADVVISNGVLNLMPDKESALSEMARVLKPGGRLQLADILVQKPVSEAAKQRIDLWTG